MKAERMGRLDLHINESLPVTGNFLSLHFSFSFSHHLSFCCFFSSSALCIISCFSILCKSSVELAHILIFATCRNKDMSPCYQRVGKTALKGSGTEIKAIFSNIPLLKEEFSVILKWMTVSCLQDCCQATSYSVQKEKLVFICKGIFQSQSKGNTPNICGYQIRTILQTGKNTIP